MRIFAAARAVPQEKAAHTEPDGEGRVDHRERLAGSWTAGRTPVKRVVGEVVEVWADIFTDGHDKIGAELLFRACRTRMNGARVTHGAGRQRPLEGQLPAGAQHPLRVHHRGVARQVRLLDERGREEEGGGPAGVFGNRRRRRDPRQGGASTPTSRTPRRCGKIQSRGRKEVDGSDEQLAVLLDPFNARRHRSRRRTRQSHALSTAS